MTGIRDLFERGPLPPLAPLREADVIRDLGDGLVLRHARAEDVDAVAAFNRCAHADGPDFDPEEHVFAWTHELLGGKHPRVSARDFCVVEEVASRRVASSLCLIPQKFRIRGDLVDVGQIELVGTHPDFRRRGLIRTQVDLVHEWSAERGEQAQVIDGIPGYYRQFGYQMAIEIWGGRRYTPAQIEAICQAGDASALRGRAMKPSELDLLGQAYDALGSRSAVSCVHDDAQRAFEFAGRPGSMRERFFRVLEDESGPRVVLCIYPILLGGTLYVTVVESLGGAPLGPWAASILDDLHKQAIALPPDGEPVEEICLRLGTEHPFYDATPGRSNPQKQLYAAYLRVADPTELLRTMSPGLQARLAASSLRGFDGALTLSEYQRGTRLVFEAGRLACVGPWQPTTETEAGARFPELSLLHLLTGHRSIQELEDFYPDCGAASPTEKELLDVLFPKQSSNLLLAD